MAISRFFAPAALAVIVSACATAPAANAQNEEIMRTITVSGEGKAAAAPDMAVISIGVQSEAATAAAALRQNSEDMRATLNKLKDLGVADRDLQTSGLSVNPRYDYKRNQSRPPIVGYTASNTVTVRLRNLDDAGAVIDQAVQSGANSLGGISFTFAEPKPLYDEARRDAVDDAKARAELLTRAAGVKLGRLITINDGHAQMPGPRPMMARMESAADNSVPIATGESVVTATVNMIYEIE